MEIMEDTTDNFGNRLLNEIEYIPVILTMTTASEDDQKQFTNALSDFEKTSPFTYAVPTE
jgi:hypothetical protein